MTGHFNEPSCIPSDPRPGFDVCQGVCGGEPFYPGDDRIEYDHPRVGKIPLCWRCAGKFMAEDLAEGLAAIASIETRIMEAAE